MGGMVYIERHSFLSRAQRRRLQKALRYMDRMDKLGADSPPSCLELWDLRNQEHHRRNYNRLERRRQARLDPWGITDVGRAWSRWAGRFALDYAVSMQAMGAVAAAAGREAMQLAKAKEG